MHAAAGHGARLPAQRAQRGEVVCSRRACAGVDGQRPGQRSWCAGAGAGAGAGVCGQQHTRAGQAVCDYVIARGGHPRPCSDDTDAPTHTAAHTDAAAHSITNAAVRRRRRFRRPGLPSHAHAGPGRLALAVTSTAMSPGGNSTRAPASYICPVPASSSSLPDHVSRPLAFPNSFLT
jgi:hypothetical protein